MIERKEQGPEGLAPPQNIPRVQGPSIDKLNASFDAFNAKYPDRQERIAKINAFLGVEEPVTTKPANVENGDPNWYLNEVLRKDGPQFPLARPNEQAMLFKLSDYTKSPPDEEAPVFQRVAGLGIPIITVASLLSNPAPDVADVATPSIDIETASSITAVDEGRVEVVLPGATEAFTIHRANLTPEQNEALDFAIIAQYEQREKVEDPNSIFEEIQYVEDEDVLHIKLNADTFRDGETPITIDRLARVHNMDARDLFDMVKDQLGENPDPNVIPQNTVLTYSISNPLKVPVHTESEPGNESTLGTAGNIASQFGRWGFIGAADLLNTIGIDETDARELIAFEDFFVVPVQANADQIVLPKPGEGSEQLAARLGISARLFEQANATNGYLWEGTEYVKPAWTTMDGEGPGATGVSESDLTPAADDNSSQESDEQDVIPEITGEEAGSLEEDEPARIETEEDQEQPPAEDGQETEQRPDDEEIRDFTKVESDTIEQYNKMLNKQIPTTLKDRYTTSIDKEEPLITTEEYLAHIEDVVTKIESGEYDESDIERANFRFLAEQLIGDNDHSFLRGETKLDLLAAMIINEYVQGSDSGYYIDRNLLDSQGEKPPLNDSEFAILVGQLVGANELKGGDVNRTLLLSELFERLENGATEFKEIAKGVEHTYVEGQDIRYIAEMYGVPVHYVMGLEEEEIDAEVPENYIRRRPEPGTKLFIASGVLEEGRIYEDYHPAPEITETNEIALNIWNTRLYLRRASSKVPFPSEYDLQKMIDEGITVTQDRDLMLELMGEGSWVDGVDEFMNYLKQTYSIEGSPEISDGVLSTLITELASNDKFDLHTIETGYIKFLESGNIVDLFGLNEAEQAGYQSATRNYGELFDRFSSKYEVVENRVPAMARLLNDARSYATGELTDKKLRDREVGRLLEVNDSLETMNDAYRFNIRQDLYDAGISTTILTEEEEKLIASQIEIGTMGWYSINDRIEKYLADTSSNLAEVLAGGIIINVEPGMEPGYIAKWTGSDVESILKANGINDATAMPVGPLLVLGVEHPDITYESVLPVVQTTPSATTSSSDGATQIQEIVKTPVESVKYSGLTVNQLAHTVLNHPNITVDTDSPNNRVFKSILDIMDDGKTFTHVLENDNDDEVAVSADLLIAVLELADNFPVQINSLTTGNHSDVSRHYRGMGMDIEVDEWTPEIMKYLWNNAERLGIHELIWNGTIGDIPTNGVFTLKHGQPYVWSSGTENSVMGRHENHLHFSVEEVTGEHVVMHEDVDDDDETTTGTGDDSTRNNIRLVEVETREDGFPADAPAEYREHEVLKGLSDSFWQIKRNQPSLDYAEEHYNSLDGDPWGPRYEGEDIVRLAYAAGFRGDELVTIVAIAKAESGFAAFVYGDDDVVHEGDKSIGPLQDYESPKRNWSGGERDSEDNMDGLHNFQSGHTIFKQQGFGAWTTFTNNAYLENMPEAAQLVDSTDLNN